MLAINFLNGWNGINNTIDCHKKNCINKTCMDSIVLFSIS
jgi:hypothetical protein